LVAVLLIGIHQPPLQSLPLAPACFLALLPALFDLLQAHTDLDLPPLEPFLKLPPHPVRVHGPIVAFHAAQNYTLSQRL
jgi:hypothetical protein